MIEDEMRDQLEETIAEALLEHSPVYSEVYDEQRCACGSPIWDGIDAHRADALLPTVRKLIETRDREFVTNRLLSLLADERAKARAPFLALADELSTDNDDPGFEASPDYWAGLSEAADRIRRAAEEPAT